MKLGKNITPLQDFLTDDQILEVLILFEKRKLEASKLLRSYIGDKWNLTVLEAVKILENTKL